MTGTLFVCGLVAVYAVLVIARNRRQVRQARHAAPRREPFRDLLERTARTMTGPVPPDDRPRARPLSDWEQRCLEETELHLTGRRPPAPPGPRMPTHDQLGDTT